MKIKFIYILFLFTTFIPAYGQIRPSNNKSLNSSIVKEILESPIYSNQSKKTSKTNSLGNTKFYLGNKEQGNTEKTNSGIIKFFNNKSEYIGMAQQRPNEEIHIYDFNNQKIGIIEESSSNWVNDVFWTYFYK